jgi:hypothetical protein
MRFAYAFAASAFLFTGAAAFAQGSQSSLSAEEKAFQQADKNHDGSLDPAEYAVYQLLVDPKGGSDETSQSDADR